MPDDQRANEVPRPHPIDNTISPREHWAILRDQMSAFKNDYTNREIRIGATIISWNETDDQIKKEGYYARNGEYWAQIIAFDDHIAAIRELMVDVYEKLSPFDRMIVKVQSWLTRRGL